MNMKYQRSREKNLQREYVEELCYTGPIGNVDCFDMFWYIGDCFEKKNR